LKHKKQVFIYFEEYNKKCKNSGEDFSYFNTRVLEGIRIMGKKNAHPRTGTDAF